MRSLILPSILSIIVIIINAYLWCIGAITEHIITGFASEFLAVVLGLYLGINLDRYIQERKGKETKSSILKAIKDEIECNKEHLTQIQKNLATPSTIIFYTLSLGTWKSTSEKMLDSIKNQELVRDISRIYFEYEHMCRKIDVQLQSAYSIERASPYYMKFRKDLVKAIMTHAEMLLKMSDLVLIEIDKELSKKN